MDVRVRQAVNLAINREDLIEYASKGNGVTVPALIPLHGYGHNRDLAPYPFDPGKARHLLREAGYPDGLALLLIAPNNLQVQATVVSKMLEQVGLTVDLRMLDPLAYGQKVFLNGLDQPAEQQAWDIALALWGDPINFPVFEFYRELTLNGFADWVEEEPELAQLDAQVLRTVDREAQQQLIRQMERHTHEHAYFLFLYNPIKLFAVNKSVEFMPDAIPYVSFKDTAVTEQHWSVRPQGAAVQK